MRTYADVIEDAPYIEQAVERAYDKLHADLGKCANVGVLDLYYDEAEYCYSRKAKLEIHLAARDVESLAALLRRAADALEK